MNNCRSYGRYLHKFNERMSGQCECCSQAAINFDQRTWVDEMFKDPLGGEY